jgi:hypothetical protein
MDRRHFIGLSLGALSAGPARALDRDAAARLGAEILRNRLVTADAGSLRAGLGVDTMPLSGILARGWRQEIREDFGAGRTVTVAGWMFSETEARICALAALEGA